MRRDSRTLKGKAIASLRRAAQSFNSLDDDARHTSVLLHLQHAFEMLLKAGLHERRQRIFDRDTGRSIGFKKCLNLGGQHLGMQADQVGTLRAIDALRDDEQHYLGLISEGILYAHLRAAITIFDVVLHNVFADRLADHLPGRVLPISTEPPADLDVLIDEEYTQIGRLLRPGSRRRTEARARIRTLLALEAHAEEEVEVSERDVARAEDAIRAERARDDVFPRLSGLSTSAAGAEVTIRVQMTRRTGAPVRLVGADEPEEAAAIREVDLQARYPLSKGQLANRLGLTAPGATALRDELGIDEDERCHYAFRFGRSEHHGYSEEAVRRMREALDAGIDMSAVWERHRPRRRP